MSFGRVRFPSGSMQDSRGVMTDPVVVNTPAREIKEEQEAVGKRAVSFQARARSSVLQLTKRCRE